MAKTGAWMPVYIGDYLGDTARLTTEQHGAYLLLLMDYWRNGAPPADDAVLCSITRLKMARFRAHKMTLLRFFKLEAGRLVHSRVEAEITKANQHAARYSERGRKGAEARWQGGEGDASSNASCNTTSNACECPPPSPSLSNDKGAVAPNECKELFREGVTLLVSTGSSVGAARSFIGKCRQSHGDTATLKAIREAARQQITEPKGWITKALKAAPANDAAALIQSVQRAYGKAEA